MVVIKSGQLLILDVACAHCNFKYLNIGIFHNFAVCLSFARMSVIEIKTCMLTVVYFSILQHKLVFLMQHGNFTGSFAVGVIARDKVNWLQQISLLLL